MVFCNTDNQKISIYQVLVTILILIDGFLQSSIKEWYEKDGVVTILILIDGFLQLCWDSVFSDYENVTILILIDGFLQYLDKVVKSARSESQSLF